MVSAKASGCSVCSKVFCCTECRDAHERTKHPDKPKCALCVKHTLAFNPAQDKNNNQLIGHVLLNHLPLRCKLCGDVYSKSQDFTLSQPCRWWYDLKQKLPESPCQQQPGIISSNKADINCSESKLPLTPQSLLVPEVEKSLGISDTSSVANLKEDNNLDSPPTELVRLTSTPMHIEGGALTKQNSSPSIPHFTLSKTPSSFEKRGSFGSDSSSGVEISSLSGSRFHTGLNFVIEEHFSRLNLSGSHIDSKSENHSEVELSCQQQSPSISILKKQYIDPMSGEVIMKSNSLNHANDTMEKRVRFSDQFKPGTVTSNSNSPADESEVFFEARDSFEENNVASIKKEATCSCCKNKDERKSSEERVSSTTPSDNKKIITKFEDKAGTVSSSSTSSRVFMMLVMERSDSKTFSNQDIHSLIDSGLKQLGQNTENNSIVSNLKADNYNCENNKTGCVKYTEVSNFSMEVDSKCIITKENVPPQALVSDHCLNISQDIQEQEMQENQENNDDAGGGIFSVMARVVRNALNKIPAVQAINQAITYSMPSPLANLVPTATTSTKNLSREPVSQASFTAPTSNLPTIPSPILARFRTSLSSPQLPLSRTMTLKRTRDSGDELVYSTPRKRDSPESASSSGSQSSECMLSPSLKRFRGRYRIKARPPIARMRQQVMSSPRGTSRETQRFQQGSLTIGDTLLPLPSRAHPTIKTETEQ